MKLEDRKNSLGGYLYHLADNIIGFDDEYKTRGEKLGEGVKKGIDAVTEDPLGVMKALGSGAIEEAEKLAAGPSAYASTDRPVNPDGTVPLTKRESQDYFTSMLGLAATPSAPSVKSLGKYDPNKLNIFAGRSALDDMEPIYRAAEGMKSRGATPKEIWDKLRVGYDEDNQQWQFIIDPRKAKLKPLADKLPKAYEEFSSRGKAPVIELNKILEFEDLERNYPNVAKTKIKVSPNYQGGAAFDGERNYILVGPDVAANPKQLRSVLIHELQHLVQAHDKTPGGANKSFFFDDSAFGNTGRVRANAPGEAATLAREVNLLNEEKNSLLEKLDIDLETGNLIGAPESLKRYSSLIKQMGDKLREGRKLASEYYWGSPGEVEARSAQDLLEVDGDFLELPQVMKEKQLSTVAKEHRGRTMPTYEMEQPQEFNKGGVVMDPEIDPVSGNEVPVGATSEEVRDNVDAKLSEGEYVIPANVVRYFGVAHFEKMVERATKGLEEMSAKGRIGGEEGLEIDEDDMEEMDEPVEMAEGGMVPPYDPGNFTTGFSTFPNTMQAGGNQGVQNKIYVGPDGSRRVIMFINGQPVNEVPPGFVEDTAENRAAQRSTEDEPVKEGGMTEGEQAEAQNTADWAGMSDKAASTAARAGQSFMGMIGGIFGGPAAAAAAKSMTASAQRDEMARQGLPEDKIDSIVSEPKGLMGRITENITDRNTRYSSPTDNEVTFDPESNSFSSQGISVSKDLMDNVSDAVSTSAPAPAPAPAAPSAPGDAGNDGDDGEDGYGGFGGGNDYGNFNKGGLVAKPKPVHATKKVKTYRKGGLVSRQ